MTEGPQLPKHLFWDCVFPSSLDEWNQFYFFVIERVVERGSLADFTQVRSFYGEERVREVFSKSRSIHPRSKAFGRVVFGNLKEEAACTSRPSVQKLWPY